MESPRTEFVRYIKLIIEKRYLFTVVSMILMSAIVWGSYFIPKKYEAKSTVFIESNVIEQLVKGIAITPSMGSRIQVLRDTMLGRSLILSVLRKLDLDSRAEDDKALETMIMKFQENTKIDVKKNNLINISFINKNPALAMDFVNNLVSVYVESNIFAKREEAYDATKFLDRQVDFFKDKMDKGEDEIIKFRQEQGIYVDMDERSIINEMKNYEGEIEKIKIKINELTATKDSIQGQLVGEKQLIVTMSKKDIGGTIGALEKRLKQLLVSYTENYPEVIKIKADIEALKQQQSVQTEVQSREQPESEANEVNTVYQELKQKVIEIEAEIKSLTAKNKNLNELIKKKEGELRNIPESKKKLSDLIKGRDSHKSVYESLLIRLSQSEVSKQMEIEDKATTFRIIEPAILPTMPVSPNRLLLILAGIALGLLGGFGVVFLLDYIDNSIKTLEDLKTLGLPVLATIPRMQTAEDLIRIKKKDIWLYSIAGLYMICILGVFAMELLGLTYVEEFMSNIFKSRYL